MLVKTARPLRVEGVSGAGAGGSFRRMKAAKLAVSDRKSLAGELEGGVMPVMLVESSGKALKRHPGVSSRSSGKPLLVTPSSTSAASSAKTSRLGF